MAPTTIHRSQHNPYTAPASSTKSHSTSTRFLFRTAAALILSTSLTLRAFAQNPSAAQCSAYTTVDEKTLYVQGGSVDATPTSQFYALDLTVQNFNASSPPWKALSLGAGGNASPNTKCPSMTLSADKQNLLVWNSANIATYNIASDSWQPAYNLPAGTSVGPERVVTVANPGAGPLYALAGASNGSRMLSWTASSNLVVSKLPMPDFVFKGGSNETIAGYAAAWSTARNSMLLIGGFKGRAASPHLFEYTPASNKWEQAKQTGTGPSNGLVDHCMVPANNGTRMVVFGGVDNVEFTTNGAIYFLDLKTLKWTKGPNTTPRSLMACAAARDNFIVWGGVDESGKSPSQPMMIYNMKTNAWTNQFIGPIPPPPPPSPTPSPSQGTSTDGTGSTFPSSSASSLPSKSNNDSSDTSKNAYLIGGFAAAVVVLAIIAILGYRRYRTKKPKDLPKEEFYADFEAKHHHHHDDERGQPMDEDYLRERMAHHPQRSPRISPPILDTYSERSPSPDPYDDDDRRVPDEEEYHRRCPSPDEYNRRSSSPVYEMPPPVLMSRSTPTPPPSRRAAAAAAAAAAYSDDGRHGSKASYQGSDGGRRAGGRGGGRGSHTGSGSGSAAGSGSGGGGAGGYVSDSDDPTTPRHDMTPRSYSPSRYRQPRYPHPNTPSPRPAHNQSSPSHQHQQQQHQQQQQQQQFEPHSLSTLTPVHHGNRVRPQNNNSREQQVHPDDFRAMDDATLYSQMKVMMQAVDERNRR